MTPVVVVAAAGLSALGTGAEAWEPRARHCRVAHDAILASAGLRKPFVARVPFSLPEGEDRAAALLSRAIDSLVSQLDSRISDWRTQRVGLVLGTSGGGMPTFAEQVPLLDRGESVSREDARRAPYFGAIAPAIGALGLTPEPLSQVLVACASSTFAIGLAARWLELDAADLVIAGGYDALSPFIAAGFECLGATSERPLPFREARTGLALGEGAGVVALVRATEADDENALGRVLGFGAASDAVHATAPDREGMGLYRAASAALEDAGASPESIGFVSAHGTATSYNDAAESKAISRVLGSAVRSASVQPFKGVIGHTLGAAGVLESLSALSALKQGILPGAVGEGAITPELEARLLEEPEPTSTERCLKLSSAFGGANVSLVLGKRNAAGKSRQRFDVRVLEVGAPVEAVDAEALARDLGVESSRVSRLDAFSLLVLGAVARLRRRPASMAGVVVGSIASTLEIDADFERRRRARGPEPRRFPATSPNLAPGNCSILLGLVGPTLAVGADTCAPVEALLVGHDLVALGDAEEMVVVAGDSYGPLVEKLFRAAELPLPRLGAQAVLLARGAGGPTRVAIARELARAREGLWPEAAGWPALRKALQRLGHDGDLPG